MKSKIKTFRKSMVVVLIFSISIVQVNSQNIQNKIYMAIELNNVVCGYSEITFYDSLINSKKFLALNQKTFASYFALGKDINQYQKFTYIIDPISGNFIYHDSYHKQGNIELSGAVLTKDDTIRLISSNSKEIILPIPSRNAILPNTIFYNYLLDDFNMNNVEEKTYQIYNFRTGNFSEISYTKLEEHLFEYGDKKYEALVFNESNQATGLKSKLWIDKNTGIRLKIESPNKMSMYLTDRSVLNKIKTGNWDEIFFAKTNESIDNIHAISYMKVKCNFTVIPSVSLPDINIPGQKFTGSINDDKVAGIYEISHKKYSGQNAPPFPLAKEKYNFPEVYIEPEGQIESNDPTIQSIAKKITEGSDNIWEASCRLSKWVAENINGSILDGSARETLERKNGLCGAQSKLMAALCRSVGIPARVVWGCLYTPEYGGSFGHHGWNEIYMGEEGWIPIDVTIHETNFVDSGHIRLGVLNTQQTVLNFEEMEILDFEILGSE